MTLGLKDVFGATSRMMMMEVRGGTSHVITKVYDSTRQRWVEEPVVR